jgi:hypothetical protein
MAYYLYKGGTVVMAHHNRQAIGVDAIVSQGWYLDDVGKSWVEFYKVKDPAGAVGGEACSWGEHSNHFNMDQCIFGHGCLAAVAERLWS